MRVASTRMQQSLTHLLGRASERMVDLQRQLATGKRLHKPSDDPSAVMQSLGLRKLGFENRQFQRNIDDALSWNQSTEVSLQAINEALMRMKEVAVQGSNDALDERAALGDEVAHLLEEIFAHSQDRSGDRYLYGGFRTSAPPYTSTTAIVDETFTVGALDQELDLAQARLVAGSAVVREVSSGATLVEGVDYSIDSESGRLTPLSGGAMTVGADYRIDYETTTLGGVQQPQPIAGDMLRQVGADQTVIVNLTAPEVFEGGVNLFDLGVALKNALWKDDSAAVNALMNDIDAALDHVEQVLGVVGSRSQSLVQQRDFLERQEVQRYELLSNLEDADLTETAIELQAQQGAYEAALATASRLLQIDILDYL